MTEAIQLLVVDDHPVVRQGLVTMLETAEDLEVVAEAGDGDEAVARAEEHEPDVVLLDLEMPEAGGIEAIGELRERSPESHILVFTAFDTDDLIVDAVRAGVDGYLLKGTAREELFDAIRDVAAGESIIPSAITTRLLARVGDDGEEDPLTPRETEVLELLAKGLPNGEIAEMLSITDRTVKFHVSSILEKLDVENRTEAVSRAIQMRLVEV